MATDALDQLRTIYFTTTRSTIDRDLARAIALFKTLPDDETRERAAGLMDGLSQLRSEWASGTSGAAKTGGGAAGASSGSRRRSRR